MPTLHSHTHCQAARANAKTQAWQRVRLSIRTTKTTDKPLDEEEHRTNNTGLAKVAVHSSKDTFVVNKVWFSASTFVVKIATFAKPETVIGQDLIIKTVHNI
jgi:hypothetical protein